MADVTKDRQIVDKAMYVNRTSRPTSRGEEAIVQYLANDDGSFKTPGHNLAVNMLGVIVGLGRNKPSDPELPFATSIRLVLHRVNYHTLLYIRPE